MAARTERYSVRDKSDADSRIDPTVDDGLSHGGNVWTLDGASQVPYLNLELGFHRHPKVKRLVGLLGRGAEVLLTRLWCHCGEHHCVTGMLTGYSGQEIESITEWWGKPGACIEALVKLGFLTESADGYAIKDWLEHSGHLSAMKERGRANAKKRWDQVRKDAVGNAASIPNSNAPKKEGIEGSKDSSKMGSREFFNPGIHHEVSARAKEVVAYYYLRVAPSRLSTAAVAERMLAQLFLDEPNVREAEIVAGIDKYAKECCSESPSMRCPPKRFIEERRWESYDGTISVPVPVEQKLVSDSFLDNLGKS